MLGGRELKPIRNRLSVYHFPSFEQGKAVNTVVIKGLAAAEEALVIGKVLLPLLNRTSHGSSL